MVRLQPDHGTGVVAEMVFKRRKQLTWLQQARGALYPRTGWRRAANYVGHRLKRISDTPHNIAMGIGVGVFVSFSPLFGLHFLYAALLAIIIRANVLAALLGTFFGNPLTFPFIAAISYRFGRQILGLSSDPSTVRGLRRAMVDGVSGLWSSLKSLVGMGKPRWDDVGYFWTDIFMPYFVGGLLPGLLAGVVAYFVSRPIVAAYKTRRRGFLAKIAEKRKKKPSSSASDPAE